MNRIPRSEGRRRLAAAQKPAAGVPAYLRWVNRPLGGRIAVVGASMGAHPNGVTAISGLLGAAGIGVLIVFPQGWAGIVACLLLLAGYAFDSADGQLARLQGRGGPAGEWLDHVVDAIRAPAVLVAVAIHLVRAEDEQGYPLALVALAFSVLTSSWFLSQILAEKLIAQKPHPPGRADRGIMESLVKQPQDSSTTYLVIGLIGLPTVFAVVFVGLFAWQLLIFLASLRRKYAQLRST